MYFTRDVYLILCEAALNRALPKDEPGTRIVPKLQPLWPQRWVALKSWAIDWNGLEPSWPNLTLFSPIIIGIFHNSKLFSMATHETVLTRTPDGPNSATQ